MSHYKLREGDNIRKPVVKRTQVEVHIPVLLICFALAFLIWLYVVSISKINREHPPMETPAVTDTEAKGEAAAEPRDATAIWADPAVGEAGGHGGGECGELWKR